MLMLNRFYPRLYEGVGDKYAEREFNIPDETIFREKKPDLVGIITHSYSGKEFKEPTKVYANPKSLDDIDSFVRALILQNGDLYVAEKSRYVIHVDILALLIREGIITGSLKPEDLQDLIDIDLNIRKALGVQRVGKRDMFAISEESYMDLNNMKYLNAAEKKNPTLKFANKNVFALEKELRN